MAGKRGMRPDNRAIAGGGLAEFETKRKRREGGRKKGREAGRNCFTLRSRQENGR